HPHGDGRTWWPGRRGPESGAVRVLREWPRGSHSGKLRSRFDRFAHSVRSLSTWLPATGRDVAVDLGTANTLAFVRGRGIVLSESVRVGGYDLDEAIAADVRRRHNLALGAQTAEALKIELGSAWPLQDELQTEIRGRDLVSGLPRQVILTTEEVREALAEPLATVVTAVRTTLERTPPELAADIVERGIMLAGGGALLRGLDERLRQETHMPVYIAENPLECVAIGAGRSLDEFEAMQRSARAAAGGRRR